MLTSANIKDYLKNDGKQFIIFDIEMTSDEQDAIDKITLKTDKIYEFIHCSTTEIDNLDNLENFIKSILDEQNDEQVKIISALIKRIIKTVMDGYEKKHYFLVIKTLPILPDYDIPRWHCDGKPPGFEARDDRSKFATVLKGPGTLFIRTTPEERKVFIDIEKNFVNTLEYRKELADKIKGIRVQLGKNQGAIFMAAHEGNQETCGIHSEPKHDKPRLFLSILPGSKQEIIDTMEYYKKIPGFILSGGNIGQKENVVNLKEKYLKYKSKYLQLKYNN